MSPTKIVSYPFPLPVTWVPDPYILREYKAQADEGREKLIRGDFLEMNCEPGLKESEWNRLMNHLLIKVPKKDKDLICINSFCFIQILVWSSALNDRS